MTQALTLPSATTEWAQAGRLPTSFSSLAVSLTQDLTHNLMLMLMIIINYLEGLPPLTHDS